MVERVGISKRLRFEVFKRDSFTCQYCGRKAPEIVLQCDHINPVVAGGDNDILNLVTSCVDCNSGKGARVLSENQMLTKQLDQLEELNQRREQIEMMIDWRNQLRDFDDNVLDRLEERWLNRTEAQFPLNPSGRDELRKWIKRYGVDLVLRAMDESTVSKLCRDTEQKYTHESVIAAFNAIGKFASVMKMSDGKPHLRQVLYIRGILRNRLSYVNHAMAVQIMEDAHNAGVDLDEIQELAKVSGSWTRFRDEVLDLIEVAEAQGDQAQS